MSAATSEPRRAWRRAFTLIEVIGAVAAFTIAFLAGSAAFARLLQQQTVSYQRTVAASAAMLLTGWHAGKTTPGGNDFVTSITDDLVTEVSTTGNLQFKGDDFVAGEKLFVFNTTTADFTADRMATYRSIVVTITDPAVVESDSGMYWRQLTMWQGQRDKVVANERTTLHYLGRYLVPDRHP